MEPRKEVMKMKEAEPLGWVITPEGEVELYVPSTGQFIYVGTVEDAETPGYFDRIGIMGIIPQVELDDIFLPEELEEG